MENLHIRLKSIKIKDFKNIENSSVELENEKKKCVTGIYGPNGSGKTAVIKVISLLKKILLGESIKLPYYDIRCGQKQTVLTFNFSYGEYILNYKAQFKASKNEKSDYVDFDSEELEILSDKTQKFIIKVNRNKKSIKEGIVINKEKLTGESNYYESFIEAFTLAKHNNQSFIFGKFNDVMKHLKLTKLVNDFNFYARFKMTVIEIDETYGIAVNNFIPLHVDYEENTDEDAKNIYYGIVPINLLGESKVPVKIIEPIKVAIESCNKVLSCLIKNFQIKMVVDSFTTYDKFQNECHNIIFNSVRNDIEIPLIYESEGIKKLISMSAAFIACFNHTDSLVAIDELDAGVFEILLGEIVKVLDKRGKGQFIFTSHNLRILEVVSPKSILITSLNSTNKFNTFKNVKPTNNFRNLYLRALLLDTDNHYYDDVDEMDLALALRVAAKGDK